MAPCYEAPLTRIEKIKKNQLINRGSSPYNEMPQNSDRGADQNNSSGSQVGVLPPGEMTPIVTPDQEVPDVNAPLPGIGTPLPPSTPELIPNAPTFTVPANPLLPEGYREILDYNAVQYVNGFYRTQIGRYVRIEQLMGSNTIETKEGFLIGVGINYIILQEGSTGNILVVDIFGIKNMYVFYNFAGNPFEPFRPTEASAETEAEQ